MLSSLLVSLMGVLVVVVVVVLLTDVGVEKEGKTGVEETMSSVVLGVVFASSIVD